MSVRPWTWCVTADVTNMFMTCMPSSETVRHPSAVGKVEQDAIRRELLREPDLPNALNIDLIATIVTRCLAGGYDVILEGILDASRYGTMLRSLIAAHPGRAHVFR